MLRKIELVAPEDHHDAHAFPDDGHAALRAGSTNWRATETELLRIS